MSDLAVGFRWSSALLLLVPFAMIAGVALWVWRLQRQAVEPAQAVLPDGPDKPRQ